MLGEGSIVGETNRVVALGPAVNKLDYEETRTSRSFHASLTDAAVSNLGGSLAGFVAGRVSAGTSRSRHVSPINTSISDGQQAVSSDDIDVTYENTSGETSLVIALPPVQKPNEVDQERLRQVFRRDGDRLRLDETRIKASSKADAVQRLTLLLLYAQELEGREAITRAEWRVELEDFGLYDGNSRKWLANSQDLLLEVDSIRLRIPGREKARKFLDQVLDLDVPDKWPLGSAPRKRSTKSSNTDDGGSEDNPKSSRRKASGISTKRVGDWVAAWKPLALALPTSPHMILKDRPWVDKAIFGLWAIRRATNDEEKVVSRVQLAQFIQTAFEFKTNDRTVGRALESSPIAEGKVFKIGGTKFQIQPPGMEYAERLTNLQVDALPVSASSDEISSTNL